MHPYETVTANNDPRSTLRSLLNDFKVVVARKAFCLTVSLSFFFLSFSFLFFFFFFFFLFFFAIEPSAVL